MKFSLSKKRWDQIITFLGFVGFVIYIILSSKVFPSSAIDLSVRRDVIRDTAIAYVEKSDPKIIDYESTQSFSESYASIYLQKTLGIPKTNERVKSENLPIYSWYHRYFRPNEQEEYSVELSPQGEIVGFDHTIADTVKGSDLPEVEAQKIAESYLSGERKWNLSEWELVDSSSVLQQSNRRDHSFSWKLKKFDIGEAELRLSVTIQGNKIGNYSYYIKVPEEFSRDFDKERNLGYFFTRIAYLVGYYSALLATFLFFIVAIALGKISWKTGLWLVGLFGFFSFAESLNYLILWKEYYWTTENYILFWVEQIYNIFFWSAMRIVPIYFLWVGGKQLVKKVWQQEDKFLPRSLNRWHIFSRSYWRGLMMAGIGLGYLMIFYGIAIRWFSAWSPMDTNYSDFFATPLPFLAPLASGVIPAIEEELFARFVGIALFYWLTKRWWLAVLIPNVLWAMMHVSYVTDPFYLRAIELSIEAILVYGLLFLKFDLVTTIVGHCTYNALLGTDLLLRAKDPYLVFSGVFVIVILLAPLVFSFWKQRQVQYRSESFEFGAIAVSDFELLKIDIPELANYDWEKLTAENTIEHLGIWIGDRLRGLVFADCIEGVATVQLIYIHPDYRRCYFGTKLVQQFRQSLQEKGIEQLEMSVLQQNEVLQKFWRNQDWQPRLSLFAAP